MSFFTRCKEVLDDGDLESKFSGFEALFDDFRSDKLGFEDEIIEPLISPSYAKFAQIYEMKELKKQKSADKNAAFLHSIAHIEYSAIDIALDACYRFRGLPKEYYFDWLEVAGDEIRHFKMIDEQLQKTGYKYGDLSVHNGLFIALQKTQGSLLNRMAVLPRFMEANGLDANLFMMEKIKTDASKNWLTNTLKIIHHEEIDHVKKGDKWFKFACKEQGVDPNSWINIVLKHYPNAFSTKRELDEAHRIMAGFSTDELEAMKKLQLDKEKL
ncbi:putative protein (DUF455 domain) [Campylobacter iguaniorum]|uniref:ferritin-like domain-containing protein n=1 Tax=Campylobacter iguaniorum TaxID=1244531 RepID=UPI00073A0059|nr:ferritin-like domain-containing protein [Campylobacter iguaniorum]ALV24428.1 putative protein (DUF455 domain) [Campylobacter iguaniorum]